MKITVLIENTGPNDLLIEHGLSLLIENNHSSYLLDAGSTSAFMSNAKALNVSINNVKCCILSHGHCDYSGGYDAYLSQNQNVTVYAMKNVFEQYYSASGGVLHNIAVPVSIQQNYIHRFTLIDRITQIDENVYLIPHHSKHLQFISKRSQLYIKKNHQFISDNFSHELSLVFETSKGLIIFNSCFHAGLQNIIEEVKQSLPNQKIYAFIGGLHLKEKKNGKEICAFSKKEIKIMCEYLIKENIQLYTGHCTGLIGFKMLKKIMEKKVHPLITGSIIEI